MPYTRLFYHLVWATRDRQPRLTQEVEPILHNLLRNKAIDLGGSVFALDGVADHVHMVASIPPAVSVAKFVGQVKGASSSIFNKSGFTRDRFYWQEEYGAFSFDLKRLPNYVAYVENQKQHHDQRSTIPVLERTTQPDEVREPQAVYALEDEAWRQELLTFDT